MSNLIEQAVKRLAQLRQAGAEIPENSPGLEDSANPSTMAAEPTITARQPSSVAVEEGPPVSKPVGTRSRSRLVELDLDAIAAAGMVSPNAPGTQIAEQYRVIKRPLLANAAGKGTASPIDNGNLVMVTSALPNEGKTFNAINLAMSIATELDHTVMLVDADVARPSLLQLLGLPEEPGLLDLLQNESLGLADTLLRTNIEKLSILPSGTPHPRATELLASDAMGRLLKDMASRYKDRIIIFDSPPLLVTTESHVLATHMGQVVVVVEAERTQQGELQQALATIQACPIKLLILNKAKVEFKRGYSYGYGYAYGYS